jgi:uncharacterized protein
MKLARRSIKVLAAGAIAMLFGCGPILAPRPDTSKFFVLTPAADAPSTAAASNGPAIGLGPVRIPAYLERHEVATRTANEVTFSANDRWAEPLPESFTRVLAADLAAQLNTDQVAYHPWFGSNVDYRIEVEVERFERDDKGSTNLAARWMVKDGKTGNLLVGRDSNISHPAQGGDSEATAAALSADVGDLSTQIASAVRDLQAQRPKPATAS